MSVNGAPQSSIVKPAPQIVYTITITVDVNGELRVEGPMNNLMLMYGMLEVAKDVTRRTVAEMANRVQTPTEAERALIKM